MIAAGGIAGLIGVALKAVEATYMENRDILNFPRGTILDHTWVSVLAICDAGVFALLLRTKAAEEVDSAASVIIDASANLLPVDLTACLAPRH